MPGLIDIGANLAHDSFDADRDAVLARAAAAGVAAIVVTGSSADSARKALALARAGGPIPLYATAGLHPHHASEWSAAHDALFRELAADAKLVSLGECGLDYFRDLSPRPAQRAAFEAQLAIAAELGKPLFLHQRDAHADFLAMLAEHRPQLREVVVHCFTDTAAARDDYLALGCSIGITGWICDERRGLPLREVARGIPLDRLMVETDAPYLTPRSLGRDAPRRNEPCYLPEVVKALAQVRGEDEATLGQATAANARRFFRL